MKNIETELISLKKTYRFKTQKALNSFSDMIETLWSFPIFQSDECGALYLKKMAMEVIGCHGRPSGWQMTEQKVASKTQRRPMDWRQKYWRLLGKCAVICRSLWLNVCSGFKLNIIHNLFLSIIFYYLFILRYLNLNENLNLSEQ